MRIGEIRRSEEIGYASRGQKWIWLPCLDCGKERWVKIKDGKPTCLRCRACATKISGKARRGIQLSQETRLKMSQTNTGEGNPMFGRHHSEETKQKMRCKRLDTQNMRGSRPAIYREQNPNYRGGKVVLCDNCGAELYRCPYRIRDQSHHFCNAKCMGEWQSNSSEFLTLVMKSNQIKPNKKELALLGVIKELSLPYDYVGDGQFILGGKCPDFLNTNGQKKLIEFWGDFWHNGQDPKKRIDYFSQYGFCTLVIWEHEMENLNQLKQKLLKFEKVP